MTYETFTTSILNRLEQDIPNPKKIQVQPVTRNNGETLDGLVVLEGDMNVGPTIYLNHCYEQYQDGAEFDDVYRQIVDTYERNKCEHPVDVAFFTAFERVKDRIMVRLVNRKQNAAVLGEKYPYVPFLDLAMVFYCNFPVDSDAANATIQIEKSHLDMWGITAEELFPIAMENTMRENAPRLTDINTMLNSMMVDAGAEPLPEPASAPLFSMYVLTNDSDGPFGAVCLAYEGLLRSYADKFDSDYYILPSSIHEVLLVPTNENNRADDFSAMVREVNETQVAPEDILSDHAYYYSRAQGLLSA